MATKNNPGKYDCYANADPDEPMFVLLGRDRHAAVLVWMWAAIRKNEGEDLAKVVEARDCSAAMARWCEARGKIPMDITRAIKAVTEELKILADSKGG